MLSKLKAWAIDLIDAHTRKGRHSIDYIHLFYVDPSNYVGAHA